jgi:hypothetical protein
MAGVKIEAPGELNGLPPDDVGEKAPGEAHAPGGDAAGLVRRKVHRCEIRARPEPDG